MQLSLSDVYHTDSGLAVCPSAWARRFSNSRVRILSVNLLSCTLHEVMHKASLHQSFTTPRKPNIKVSKDCVSGYKWVVFDGCALHVSTEYKSRYDFDISESEEVESNSCLFEFLLTESTICEAVTPKHRGYLSRVAEGGGWWGELVLGLFYMENN